MRNKIRIGIVGAGIAGLQAGIRLQREGLSVQIYEARSKPGGRIQSLHVQGYLVEAGPEFIHGHGRETIGLLDKYGIAYLPADGKMYWVRDGRFTENGGMVAGWDQLLEKMQTPDADLPLNQFLEKTFPGKQFSPLKEMAIRFAEGFDLADVQTASTMALGKEWALGDMGTFRITDGYSTLIQAMAEEFCSLGGEIFLKQAVDSVVWYPGDIQVSTRGNHHFQTDKLIISLPLSIMCQEAPKGEQISFSPSLDIQQEEMTRIGFGTVVKIVMIWDSPFWETLIPEGQYLFSNGFIPTWWTQYPSHIPLLTGWLGGPAAGRLSEKTDEFFLEKSLESLSSVFSMPARDLRKRLKDFRIFNWKNIPWSRGAYSFSQVGSAEAKALCRKSLDGRIYFAGEAYYEGPHPGTVEAAVISGLDSAALLLAELE